MSDPTKEDVKATRGHLKQSVSLRSTNIERLVAEGADSNIVEGKLKELKDAFSKFERTCKAFTDLLDVKTESDEISAAMDYLMTAEKEYCKTLVFCREQRKRSPIAVSDKPVNSVANALPSDPPVSPAPIQVTVQAPANAPVYVETFKPLIFTGSPLEFPLWKASVDAFMECLTGVSTPFSVKMFHLRSFTAGEAQAAIESCFLVPNEKSYIEAWKILTERFGNSVLVTTAFRNKIDGWPRVGDRDKRALQSFSDFLKQVRVAALTYTALDILDDQFENQKLVRKIPNWLATKWIGKVVQFHKDAFPKFTDFCDFIDTYAQISNHVLWGQPPSEPSKPATVLQTKSDMSTTSPTSAEAKPAGTSQSSAPSSTRAQNMQSSARSSRYPSVAHSSPDSGTPNSSLRPSSSARCPCCGKPGHLPNRCPFMLEMNVNERWDLAMSKKLCYACLFPGHFRVDCLHKVDCFKCKNDSHHCMLHRDDTVSESKPNVSRGADTGNVSVQDDVKTSECTQYCKVTSLEESSTLAIPVIVQNGDVNVTVLALLDTMSDASFVSTSVCEALGLQGPLTHLTLKTMHGCHDLESNVISKLCVKGINDDDDPIYLGKCFRRDEIPFNKLDVATASFVQKYPHLSHVPIPVNVQDLPVGLLISHKVNPAFKPIPNTLCLGKANEPWCYRSRLGWCVQGSEENESSYCSLSSCNFALRTSCKEMILGCSDDTDDHDEFTSDVKFSSEDAEFLRIMDSGFHQTADGNYSAPLPLKQGMVVSNNRNGALKRLSSLKSRFTKDPAYKQRYANVVEEMIELGFAEVAPALEGNMVNYIPHHGVPKPSDPNGAPRVVFDCSHQSYGISLNDCLLQGPNLLNRMQGILMRFRSGAVAFTCDVRKMYHMFRVDEHHRDLLRFFWWPQGDLSQSPVEYRMTVHLFGAVSSSGVATYGMRRIVQDHGHKYIPAASEFIRRDFYVDDGEAALDTCGAAHELFSEAQKLLKEGQCHAHKVMSNSQQFMDMVNHDDRAVAPDGTYKALGVSWDVINDLLQVPLSIDLDVNSVVTKRLVLSTFSSVFDPIGYAAPLVLQIRLLFQELCRLSLSWDDAIPDDLRSRFIQWVSEARQMKCISVPRNQKPDFQILKIEVHHFADASSTAYSACSYVRFLGVNGEISVSFVVGKCKVVPIKPVFTIPRLELMAAVLECRLALVCRRELAWDYDEYFWSDSTVVLGYIQNTSARFKIFVANRVQFIHSVSSPEQWLHCPSVDNPADDGSRAIQSQRWLDGPSFLREHVDLSSFSVSRDSLLSCDAEICLNSTIDSPVCQPLPVCHNWFTTKKVYAWVLRFVNNSRKGACKRTGNLSLCELDLAEKALVRNSQLYHFSIEITKLRKGQPVPRTSRLRNLVVFLDTEDLLRVGGRGVRSDLDYGIKHPLVIHGSSAVSAAIIEHFHLLVHHQGRGITAGEIRNNGFWILGLVPAVKRLIRGCIPCKRLRGKPLEQKMADLPESRLSPSPPFTEVGCDCFGPILVKNGRRECKRYGLLLTCFYCRAVHIEMLYELSSDSFINGFRRFVSLRGPVRCLHSDQGTNFIGAADVLLKMGTDFKFNVPKASHAAGVWERMIGSARRVLEGILLEHSTRLDDESLLTIFAETSAIINSRPLTAVDDESLEPLTPNHLLMMKPKTSSLVHLGTESDPAHLYATKRWKRVQCLADLFWSRWRKEILNNLQSRQKWRSVQENLKVHDIVLEADDSLHRSDWRLARVIAVKPSEDGLVRSVTLLFANGSKLDRPVQKLVYMASA